MARSPILDPALAAAVRRLREDRGLTREQLAFRSGVTTGSLARIELGRSVPGWDTVRLLVEALGMSLKDFATVVEAEATVVEAES
ncbi:MAG TPA: helix-turn-helix transcriptional regulator [Solirubrobacteraceae bacterium]|nr:helix-turn-helix transcriptional regulator [Solirubrobacteraceae bacterium]